MVPSTKFEDDEPLLCKDEENCFGVKSESQRTQPPGRREETRRRRRGSGIPRFALFAIFFIAISFVTSLAAHFVVVKQGWAPGGGGSKSVIDYSVCKANSEFNCGSSVAEARSMGCYFQLWSYSWVPHDCHDPELHEEFLRRQAEEGWGYFRDVEGKEQIPLDVVLRGESSDIFTTWGQHFWHCAYYQRNFFLAKVGITNRDRDLHHSLHCQKWMSNPFYHPWDAVKINLTVGFHSCDSAHGLAVSNKTQDFIFHHENLGNGTLHSFTP